MSEVRATIRSWAVVAAALGESAAGKGSIFTVDLPIEPVH